MTVPSETVAGHTGCSGLTWWGSPRTMIGIARATFRANGERPRSLNADPGQLREASGPGYVVSAVIQMCSEAEPTNQPTIGGHECRRLPTGSFRGITHR